LTLSATALILSYPKVSWSLLAWVAFLPFFKSIEGCPSRERLRAGYLFGFLVSLAVFYWVTFSMRHYGHLNLLTSVSMLVLMALYLALYPALFFWAWGFRPARGLFQLFSVPAFWVVLEFLRSKLLTGFPWALLGYTQSEQLPIIQIAELSGVYGLSFLILLVNQALFQLFFSEESRRPWKEKWPEGFVPALLICLVLFFGWQRLSGEFLENSKAPKLDVSVIQGNIDQSLKWNPAYQDQTIDIYTYLTKKSLEKTDGSNGALPLENPSPPLVIWPETAVPFYFLNEGRHTPRLFDLARETGAYLLFGSPAFGQEGPRRHYFNRAYLLSPEGRINYYDKVHLVPFGEYVPLKRLLPFVNRLVESIGDFTPGRAGHLLVHPRARIGVLICFETIFPELSRACKQDGCNLLVNITNDAWFGRTSAPYQHLSMLVFRAVENRTWVARAANTGFSAFIDSTGRVQDKSSLFEKAALPAIIPLRNTATLYSRYGDWLAYGCLLLAAAWLLTFYFSRNRRR
jgi:apolipoprotein N-acyltransferase